MCHAVHRAYHASNNNFSFGLKWEEKSEEHQATVCDTVTLILNGEITNVEDSHENFVNRKLADGWSYADNYSQEDKTSPRLKPFYDLPKTEQAAEHIFFEAVNAFI